MTSLDRFGIRSVPPCSDCWEDGQCSMNCGPCVPAAPPQLANTPKVSTGICANCDKAIRKVEGFGWRHVASHRYECEPVKRVATPR